MRTTRTTIVALVLALAALPALLGGSAQAQAGGNGNGNGGDAAAEHRRVVDFWTADKRASAKPRDLEREAPNGKPGGKPGGGPPTTSTPTTTTAPPTTTLPTSVAGATWNGAGAVVKTTGKVFFTMGASRYTCSASAVDSGHGRLVLTAGHCVHDLTAGWASNWIFYPAYNGAPSAALGSWTATALFTTAGWASSEDFDDDAGFAVVSDGTATTLEAKLATNGVASVPSIDFASTNTSTHYAFGYPAAKKYSGSTLVYCAGLVSIGRYDGADTVSMTCDMTGGSSGGPWYETFANGTGVVRSLTSYGYASLKNVLFGPVLNGPEQSAYNAANTAPTCAVASSTCTNLAPT